MKTSRHKIGSAMGVFALRFFVSTFTLFCGTPSPMAAGAGSPSTSAGDEQIFRGNEFARWGDFEKAISAWQRAAAFYISKDDHTSELDALLRLAFGYRALGQYHLTTNTLETALSLAERTRNTRHLIAAKSALGAALPVSGEADRAEDLLNAALGLARDLEPSNPKTVASVLNNLGNLLAAQRIFAEALSRYAESAELGIRFGDHQVAAQALGNAAVASVGVGDYSGALELNVHAMQEIEKLEASRTKSDLLLKVAETYSLLLTNKPEAKRELLSKAADACRKAGEIARNHGDRRTLAYAWGQEGELCALDNRPAEALSLLRQAAFKAQESNSLESLYRWHWGIGRLLKTQGQTKAALAAYERAVQAFRDIQDDCGRGFGNRDIEANFRSEVGPLFFEFADLLLRQADVAAPSQHYLLTARRTMEQLKYAELQDYFQDECLHLLLTKTVAVETNSPRTAVVYFIPLPDRVELLLSLPNGFKRFKLPVSQSDLTQDILEFRTRLEGTGENVLDLAKKLHRWLIAPISDALAAEQIQTLVFVPDGPLRLLPAGALHDGCQFLAEQFAIAITPGLTLVDPQPLKRKITGLLLCGLSEAVQGFPALDYVESEVQTVRTNFPARVLLNRDFQAAAVRAAFEGRPFSIVHFATHGQFARDAKNSFLLTHDGRMTFDDLEKLVRPSQARGQPIELLILSACESAAGDDRAALGLAGVAIKSGARSALATLWRVNDEACAILMSEFYAQIRRGPSVSRAKALQAAQQVLIDHPKYHHPSYWSPFSLIGNWL